MLFENYFWDNWNSYLFGCGIWVREKIFLFNGLWYISVLVFWVKVIILEVFFKSENIFKEDY